MKEENLAKINTALDEAGITQKYLSQVAGLQNTQVNEMLNGKRTIKNAVFAVSIEALTMGVVKAKWILETALTDSIDEDIKIAKELVSKKLLHEKQTAQKRLDSIIEVLEKGETNE